MPAKATDTFTWVSGGDCRRRPARHRHQHHRGEAENRTSRSSAATSAYDNGVSAKAAVAFLQNYSKHMIDPQGRLIPMVTRIGNHEVRGGFKAKRRGATFYLPLFDGLYSETTLQRARLRRLHELGSA